MKVSRAFAVSTVLGVVALSVLLLRGNGLFLGSLTIAWIAAMLLAFVLLKVLLGWVDSDDETLNERTQREDCV